VRIADSPSVTRAEKRTRAFGSDVSATHRRGWASTDLMLDSQAAEHFPATAGNSSDSAVSMSASERTFSPRQGRTEACGGTAALWPRRMLQHVSGAEFSDLSLPFVKQTMGGIAPPSRRAFQAGHEFGAGHLTRVGWSRPAHITRKT